MSTHAASWVNVSKRYGSVQALDGFSLDLRQGEVLALVGPNGAGKTTAISALLGEIAVDQGKLEVLGQAPGSVAARAAVGVMLQKAELAAMLTVREQLELFAALQVAPHPVDEILAACGLEDLAARRYAQLSGGQQRRVQFAIALIGRPRVLLLDEPTVALDPLARNEFWRHLAERVRGGMAVLLTTHQLDEAEAVADRIAVIRGGRLIACESASTLRARAGLTRIRCRSRLAPEQLRSWPDVVEAEANAGVLELRCTAPEAILRQMLNLDAELGELEVGKPALADSLEQLYREAA